MPAKSNFTSASVALVGSLRPAAQNEPYAPKTARQGVRLKREAKRKVAALLADHPEQKKQRSELVLDVLSMKLALAEHCLRHQMDGTAYRRLMEEWGLDGD